MESAGPPAGSGKPGLGAIVDLLNLDLHRRREAFDNTVAAVNAYFSWLEHTLVLLLPFRRFDPDTESLTQFIGARWRDKLKRIFDIGTDPKANHYYDRLCQVTEEYRNPYAHGGFDKAGGTLYFHVEGFGAFPARLSDARTRPYFHFVFGTDEEPTSIWTLFDEVDSSLRWRDTRYGMSYIESGLDVPFDEGSVSEFEVAVVSEEFDEYLEALVYATDQAANMDW